MARRDEWYRRAADLVIEGTERDGSPVPKEVLTAQILSWFYGVIGDPTARNKARRAAGGRCGRERRGV